MFMHFHIYVQGLIYYYDYYYVKLETCHKLAVNDLCIHPGNTFLSRADLKDWIKAFSTQQLLTSF